MSVDFPGPQPARRLLEREQAEELRRSEEQTRKAAAEAVARVRQERPAYGRSEA
jgi:hypothetical protein